MPHNRRFVHIIDDDNAVRDSLSFLLEVQGFATQAHESATDFLAQSNLDAHCIVSDIRMPGMTGLELIQALEARNISCPVILITGHGDIALAIEAIKLGAVDFIEKPFPDELLVEAVRSVLDARTTPVDEPEKARQRIALLTPLEQDVLLGVLGGKANKMMALDLSIDPRAVEIHRANLMSKVGARSLAELVRISVVAGLLT